MKRSPTAHLVVSIFAKCAPRLTLLLVVLAGGCVSTDSKKAGITAAAKLTPPPLPILSPTALTADGGNGKVYLRWNLQLEDDRVVGWRVLQLAPQTKMLNDKPLTDPQMVVAGLTNGSAYTFAVAGVLKNGQLTPESNTVTVTPREVGQAKLVQIPAKTKLDIGVFQGVETTGVTDGADTVKVVFPDGQELTYDQVRPIDWKTRDGEHLIYPKRFGNGLDIGKFDERGLSIVIPPNGLAAAPDVLLPGHATPVAGDKEYHDAQFGNKHPCITDPMTLGLYGEAKYGNDARPVWKEPVIDGNRVTFHYWQPITAMGYRSFTYVLVWETWWPIQRERHGTMYHGLARLVEVQMPSALKDGYQVMLNNGFGPGGARRGVVSYSAGFRAPAHEAVDYSVDRNVSVTWQDPKLPRQGYGYHPNQDCLQSSPLIFYDWSGQGTVPDAAPAAGKQGCLTITARSLYYHCANQSCSYIEQGADGVWPNLAWDMTIAGQRTAVDTVEYLYAGNVSQPLPQRFINARFEAYGDVSARMGVQDKLGAVAMDAPHSQIERSGGPEKFADEYIKKWKDTGMDVLAMYHDTWQAVPITIDDAYRFDENYDCNPHLKAMNDKIKAAGLHPGLWFRPEFTKTSLPNALSDKIPTAEVYYGYSMCRYPNCVKLLHERGIPLFRQNTDWIRKRRDGSYPYETPYQWVPMSLATPWFDRIIWPTQAMTAKLGYERVLVDGGFGGLQGVDYAPMLAGKAAGAVPCQPYWWRMWRCMHYVGIDAFGECTVGWKGNNVMVGGPSDECYMWMFQMGWYIGQGDVTKSPQQAHRVFQLYNSNQGTAGNAPVRRYAMKFMANHPAPDWIEFKDLRQLEPVEVEVAGGESPVAGQFIRTTQPAAVKVKVRPWTWTDVVWHYKDGKEVVYPAYENINWAKE